MKILLLTPDIKIKGGVSIFCSLLLKYSQNDITVFTLNSNRKKNFLKPFYLVKDYFNFFFKLIFYKFDIIHVNPSLSKNAVNRDAIYILIAKLFRKKVFVFWHGWNVKNEYLLNSNLFRATFFKADHVRFLAKEFREKFVDSGFENITSIGNSFVDDKLLKYVSIKEQTNKTDVKILFLSRITESKGIFIALKAFQMSCNEFDNLFLTVAGDGPDLQTSKEYVSKNRIKNVEFIGRVEDDAKAKAFKEADIYIFPSFTEGMPISLLESMSFGNKILTSNVGGIKDIFQEKMGIMVDTLDPIDFHRGLIDIINSNKFDDTPKYNKDLIIEKYLASVSVREIDKIYKELN